MTSEAVEAPTRDALVANLKQLREVADGIVQEAYAKREGIRGAINWGDLGCRQASFCVDDYGDESYAVLIEECAPEAVELRDFIYMGLVARGWHNVSVTLEW